MTDDDRARQVSLRFRPYVPAVERLTVAVGNPLHSVLGSGVLCRTAHGPVVITCAHVIRELHGQEVYVRLSQKPGQRWSPARVIYSAPPDHQIWDLAVLTLSSIAAQSLSNAATDATQQCIQDEVSNRHYGESATFGLFEGFNGCHVKNKMDEKDFAVVMVGYPVALGTRHSTPEALLTTRRAKIIDTFHDENISRKLTENLSSQETDIYSRTDVYPTDINETDFIDLADIVAILLAGDASPGMSGGPILRMSGNGACLVGFIVTGVRERYDSVAGVLAVPAWPVVAALRLYHQSGDETVFERTLCRPSIQLGRLWPRNLLSKL